MKIAVALRTCDSVYNSWNIIRGLEADKTTILLTCLNSLLDAISNTNHEFVFSIHDDTSSEIALKHIDILCQKYKIPYEIFHTGKLGNFKSQYEWVKKQDYDFVYCVEDDFLHRPQVFNEMLDMYAYLKEFVNQTGIDYGFYPWNTPQRYEDFNFMYPVMLFKHKNKYWRSDLQSTHTFFVTKDTFEKYDTIMRQQAYNWPKKEAWDDKTICKVWQEQITRLVVPMDSLAYHLSDTDLSESETLWKEYYYEAR